MSRAALLGSWELVSCTMRFTDGREGHPFGSAPRGVILYTDADWMSCHMAHGGDADADPTVPATAYSSYHGPFSVDADRGAVVHHVRGATIDAMLGTDQQRFYAFDGDRLLLSADTAGARVEVTWRRLAPRP